MVVRDDPVSPWRQLGKELCVGDESIDVDGSIGLFAPGIKRALSPSASNVPDAKRARGTSQAPTRPSGSCLAPKPNSVAQGIIANRDNPFETSLGTGDIFLVEKFRERWCRCASVGMPISVLCLISRSTA